MEAKRQIVMPDVTAEYVARLLHFLESAFSVLRCCILSEIVRGFPQSFQPNARVAPQGVPRILLVSNILHYITHAADQILLQNRESN